MSSFFFFANTMKVNGVQSWKKNILQNISYTSLERYVGE